MKNLKALLCLPLILLSGTARADAPRPEGLNDESQAGLVIVSGNSKSQSYSFSQKNTYYWPTDLLRLEGSFLETESNSVDTAKSWALGLRYERALSSDLSAYLGELLESNVFSGFTQRYATDVGAKYGYINSDEWRGSAEAGYRYTVENQLGGQDKYSLLRFYGEIVRLFSKDVSAKLWVEFLPNLTHGSDYQSNGEISVTASLSSVFSIKSAYLVKFRNQPPAGVADTTDTSFTTALVAKF